MTARTSSIHIYSEIARESFEKIMALEPQKRTIETNLTNAANPDEKMLLEYELMTVDIELAKIASITIVFAMIAIEAYIYDYAARHFTDSFVKKYIDKLDPISKWVIIPKLVTGKELSRGGEWFKLLKDLVRERNSIIHSKSSQPPSKAEEARKYLKAIDEEHHRVIHKARNAIKLLDVLAIEIGNLDAEEVIWAESYLSKPSTTLEEK